MDYRKKAVEEIDPVAKALLFLAQEIKNLGNADAATQVGGLEGLGMGIRDAVTEAASEIAGGLHAIAQAIEKSTGNPT